MLPLQCGSHRRNSMLVCSQEWPEMCAATLMALTRSPQRPSQSPCQVTVTCMSEKARQSVEKAPKSAIFLARTSTVHPVLQYCTRGVYTPYGRSVQVVNGRYNCRRFKQPRLHSQLSQTTNTSTPLPTAASTTTTTTTATSSTVLPDVQYCTAQGVHPVRTVRTGR